MRKISITGSWGRLGSKMLQFFGTPMDVDITNSKEVEMTVLSEKPEVIVHLASISNVDECEDPANEKRVFDVNVRGTYNLLESSSKIGCTVILLSTDHVFGGKLWGKYRENDRPNPKNFYGYTKLASEQLRGTFNNLKIVRTSYLFDYERELPAMERMESGSVEYYPLFMSRSFMWIYHFLETFQAYINRVDEMPDILHISGSAVTSHYEFYRELARTFGYDPKTVQPRMHEIDNVAPRPYRAGLNVNLSKKLGLPQFDYVDGIRLMRSWSL